MICPVEILVFDSRVEFVQKVLYVPAINADVVVARRRGMKHMRISMLSDGRVRLSVPWLVSERQAMQFLVSKAEWVNKHKKSTHIMKPNDHIGKSHRIVFLESNAPKIRTAVKNNQIAVYLPVGVRVESTESQKAAHKAAERALSKEANTLLSQRLQTLATKNSIVYNNLTVKKLKSRWGSCDNQKNITLNIYLMQLDWSLIDYVILHELAHTRFQHHQIEFWTFLKSICPDYKERRKLLRQKPTSVFDTKY